MKIAICDFRFHKGHRTFNSAVLNAVAAISGGNFIYFDNGNNYRNSNGYSVQRRDIVNKNKDGQSPLVNRLNSWAYMRKQLKVLHKENCDKIICIAFDLITFGLFGKKYFKKDIYLWHHAEPDELLNSFKLKVFKRYMNKVKHIVHAPFIKDYLVKMGVDKNRISVCPFVKTAKNFIDSSSEEKFYVGPSGSNDEDFCKDLAEYEKRTNFFVNNNIKLYMKSFDTSFNDGFLTLYNNYLSYEKYEELYRKSTAVIMPFPKSFRMRESGTIIDALSSGKRVIASDLPIVHYYKDICEPIDANAVAIYSNVEDFCNILLDDYSLDSKISELIGSRHDERALEEALRVAVKS